MDKIRLTEERFPILSALRWDGDLLKHPDYKTPKTPFRAFMIPEERYSEGYFKLMEGIKHLADGWPLYQKLFTEDVTFLSRKFWESVLACRESLMKPELLEPFIGRMLSGALLAHNKVILYSFETVSLEPLMGKGVIIVMENNSVIGYYNTIEGIDYELAPEKRKDPDEMITGLAARDVLLFHLFKKYADVEVTQSKPYKKVINENGDSYLVDSSTLVNIMDCRWINTIVRSEGFKVRGHFRLQPYKKDGEWTKKLIYINEFEKHGYTRRATKLIDINNQNQE